LVAVFSWFRPERFVRQMRNLALMFRSSLMLLFEKLPSEVLLIGQSSVDV